MRPGNRRLMPCQMSQLRERRSNSAHARFSERWLFVVKHDLPWPHSSPSASIVADQRPIVLPLLSRTAACRRLSRSAPPDRVIEDHDCAIFASSMRGRSR